jgi:syntaxin-binding protein 1
MLIITDRSMDLITPLVHEFTYQAMAHDLLRIKEGDKVLYRAIVNEGSPDAQEKDMEITEKDEIWVKNRHSHMKDTIERLMGDFQKFTAENPHFTNQNANAASLNVIKDMLAGLPQFQESKEAYTLHLSMAQECMNTFQQRKLPDIASVEQSLATGLDEGYRKPKNLADQVVRLLDDESVIPADRLRLIMLYILYRDGVIPEDIQRLLAHSSLPPQDAEVVSNLDLLGARSTKALKENRPSPAPLFPRKTSSTAASEGYALSRFEPALKMLLEEVSKGILDQSIFPYTRPPLDNSEADMYNASQASLRSAKPTWAQNRRSMHESKQRIIVFMAGGATYSESRACYEVSRNSGKDIFLATSEMLTPALFVRQIADLSLDRRRLNLPSDRPRPKAPAHLFEREERTPVPTPPTVPAKPMAPRRIPDPTSNQAPIAGLGNMTLDPGGSGNSRPSNGAHSAELGYGRGKLEKKKESEEKKHKKRNFFGIR